MIAIMLSWIERLFSDARQRACAPGAILFRSQDPVADVFLVRGGCVVLERTMSTGQTLCFQRAIEGQIVAEASIYADSYHCDGRVLSRCELSVLPKEKFIQALRHDADLVEAWARHLAEAVQRARLLSEIRNLRKVSDRLSAWLALYGSLPPKGQWQSVADEIGVSREALYREIAARRA